MTPMIMARNPSNSKPPMFLSPLWWTCLWPGLWWILFLLGHPQASEWSWRIYRVRHHEKSDPGILSGEDSKQSIFLSVDSDVVQWHHRFHFVETAESFWRYRRWGEILPSDSIFSVRCRFEPLAVWGYWHSGHHPIPSAYSIIKNKPGGLLKWNLLHELFPNSKRLAL